MKNKKCCRVFRRVMPIVGSLVLLFSLCMLPFSGSAETPATLAYTFVSDGYYPTASWLNVSNVENWPLTFSGTWGSNPRYSIYNLETAKYIANGMPYIIDYDVDFTDAVVDLPYGGYFEFIIAPREQYDFVDFGCEFDISVDSTYAKWDRAGYILLSTGETINIGAYYDTFQVGTAYYGYRFRVPLPEGDYRITNFYINALFVGLGTTETYNILISDFMVYKYGSSNPLEQEIYDPPDTGTIDEYQQAEDELRDTVSGNQSQINNNLFIYWDGITGLHSALLAVSGIFNRLFLRVPFLLDVVNISVGIGIAGFLFNLLSNVLGGRTK